jgi:PBP1b-binding outer membrane lipoprotein LpoB
MILRLILAGMAAMFVAGCSGGMKIDVAPPQCTVDEKSADCSTQQQEPAPMMEEDFFRDEI